MEWFIVRTYVPVALLLAALGCGRGERPPLGTVSGTVTFDGEPLVGAVVIFEPDGARASTGVTDERGCYELTYLRDIKGAVVGRHTVRIATVAEEMPLDDMPGLHERVSGLPREVKPGRNVFDFDLPQ